ncbi:hypothetical protein EIP86_006523 [Pleurotus ostreatoroseus]|nr:hypothetical protein EIP86_006523 [Pleurotus ostreatoroseus]
MVEVLIVTTAILLATEDVTVAEPSPELSWVNFVESWSSKLLNFIEMISPFTTVAQNGNGLLVVTNPAPESTTILSPEVVTPNAAYAA